MIDCKQASQLISKSLDRRLSLRERLSLRFHTFICEACRRFGQQLNALRVALKRMNEQVENDSNIKMPSETKARIAKSIESIID
jgi:ppGpp synthetase/RelA/SpoT-type nucleotidyltranferase